ncbi:hypothetical protein [Aeromicrobium sp. Leaf350]|uniref:hypothetical protein n=1 Tax=Aeromicrobium sp. Leaf350 TaxID=2876565 RepID=UPI001E3349D4|nr:hypothetical protein [Aeromicrobium sp. Leaf350]
MGLTLCDDVSAADWIVHATADWSRISRFGPPGLAGYARVPYMSRSTAAIEPGHRPTLDEITQQRGVLEMLAQTTNSRRRCYFALWDGWSDTSLPPPRTFSIPHRTYVLFEGSIADLSGWRDAVGCPESSARIALAWPADHTWFMGSDVDPDWMGVGSSRAAISVLLGDRAFRAAKADPGASHPDDDLR